MGSVADRGIQLVDESRSDYKCDQVVGFTLYGNKNALLGAKKFLTWGVPAIAPAEGVVIVNKDGSHVGIFINDHEFIHSSLQKWHVIRRPLEKLLPTFGPGYTLRKEY